MYKLHFLCKKCPTPKLCIYCIFYVSNTFKRLKHIVNTANITYVSNVIKYAKGILYIKNIKLAEKCICNI